jgi:hypothetical protein
MIAPTAGRKSIVVNQLKPNFYPQQFVIARPSPTAVGEAKQSHRRLIALDEIATSSFHAGGLLAMTFYFIPFTYSLSK